MFDPNTIISGTIYALHNGDGEIRYIGYTTKDPKIRLKEHRNDIHRYPARHLTNWVKAIGPANLHMDILEYYSDIRLGDLWEREKACIAQGYADGLRLVNGHLGGMGGTPGKSLTAEHRAAISRAHMGKTMPRDAIERMAATRRGRPAHNKGKANPSAVLNMHRRWHVNREIIKGGCTHCEASNQKVV